MIIVDKEKAVEYQVLFESQDEKPKAYYESMIKRHRKPIESPKWKGCKGLFQALRF